MLHLFTCHGRIMPHLAELFVELSALDLVHKVNRVRAITPKPYGICL